MNFFIVSETELLRVELVRLVRDLLEATIVGTASCDEDNLARIGVLRPDAVFLDLSPYSTKGLALLRKLGCSGTRPLLLVMTDFADPAFHRHCLQLGADGLVNSGLDVDTLVSLIKAWKEGRRP